MTEQPPAVEFAEDDDSSSDGWTTYGIVALVFGALTTALAIPGVWDEHIVGYSSRKYRGIANAIEAIGYWPIMLILAGITVAAASAAVVTFIKNRQNDKD